MPQKALAERKIFHVLGFESAPIETETQGVFYSNVKCVTSILGGDPG
jgi:hypothetical protein